MKKLIIGAIALAVFVGFATRSEASPLIPPPSTCATYLVFDGWMGCLPMFHIESDCGL